MRTVENSGGMHVVQLLSPRKDYVYTTALTIRATRPQVDDSRQFVFSETPSGGLPTLHFWFPPGETTGHEFINPQGVFPSHAGAAQASLQVRADPRSSEPAPDLYAVRAVLSLVESGKLSAARDRFRRNYFLTQNREGATLSFLLALLMLDSKEAGPSLELMNRFDPNRARVMSDLGGSAIVQSLPSARKNPKTSSVRRFLLNFAMERTDDPLARTGIVTFERHVVKGDSLPVEMALDRRREEIARERKREQQWILAKQQIAKLNDCVKSLLNQVGALEYSVSVQGWPLGSIRFSVVLTRRRLQNLDSIVELSHRTICSRRQKIELLISQRNVAITHELDSLRVALRELDRQSGSTTRSRYDSIRKWEGARPAEVTRDLMALADAAKSPLMRPSSTFEVDRGYVQMNIAGSLAKLAEWVGP